MTEQLEPGSTGWWTVRRVATDDAQRPWYELSREDIDALNARPSLPMPENGLRGALEFYRDQWRWDAVGDEGDGVTDFGRLDGYEAEATQALKEDGGERARQALASTGAARGELRIVFDTFPGLKRSRFIECEDAEGKSVNAGEWKSRDDGLVELVIRSLPARATLAEEGAGDGRDYLAGLIVNYFNGEIGRLMEQAQFWADNGKPLAVHHRLHEADAYFQVVNLFQRHKKNGWGDSFDYIVKHLDTGQVKPLGPYPYSADLHRYNDVRFVVAELDRLAALSRPPSSKAVEPGACFACEGFPVAPNDPCGLCGRSSKGEG